jgi:hypothetical protein
VIVSPSTLTEIQKDPRFVYAEGSSIDGDHLFPIAGQLPGMHVYVNASGHRDSNQIVVGRKTSSAGDTGVYYCEYMNDIRTYEDPITMDTKIGFFSRHAIQEVGKSVSALYYTENIIVGKKPWWRKLFML